MRNVGGIYFIPCCWFEVAKSVWVDEPRERVVILMENEGFLSDKVYTFVQLNSMQIISRIRFLALTWRTVGSKGSPGL